MCMEKKEHRAYLKNIKSYKKTISKASPQKKRELLQRAGILTKTGNLSKNYQNLCIPSGRD